LECRTASSQRCEATVFRFDCPPLLLLCYGSEGAEEEKEEEKEKPTKEKKRSDRRDGQGRKKR